MTTSTGLVVHLNNASRLAKATRRFVLLFLATFMLGGVFSWTMPALACPFCAALAPTMSDDLEASTAAVIASCESVSAETDGFFVCKMRVTEVIKGAPKLAHSVVEVVSLVELPLNGKFWLVGFGEDSIEWGSFKQISTEAVSYVQGLSDLPERGPRRLNYFLRFLRHNDEMVADDAYNEFAEATLNDISALKDTLDRTWVLGQLRDASLPVHRRRLCWTFLSQCGTAEDAALFDELLGMRKADPTFDPGMDAAIGCYISLAGEQGLARIEQDYLANLDAGYLDCFASVSAIRVHGTELDVFSRKRLASALRQVLSRPPLADLVLADLARWEDWSSIDRVVELFENATEDTRFVKSAAVLYLKACPLPAASAAIEKLRTIDSQTVQAAEASMRFYGGMVAVPVPAPVDDEPDAKSADSVTPKVAELPQ